MCFGSLGVLDLCYHRQISFETLSDAYKVPTLLSFQDSFLECNHPGKDFRCRTEPTINYRMSNSLLVQNFDRTSDVLLNDIAEFRGSRRSSRLTAVGYELGKNFSFHFDMRRPSRIPSVFICPHLRIDSLFLYTDYWREGLDGMGKMTHKQCAEYCCATRIIIWVHHTRGSRRKCLCLQIYVALGPLVDATDPLWLARAYNPDQTEFPSQMDAYLAAGGPRSPPKRLKVL